MDKLLKTAFTLIELLVVIAIIGILSGLIVVTMSGATQKANIAKSQVFSNSLRNALMMNLVADYPLDGNANDSWGGKNGTLHGTTAVTTDCPQGSCLSFNGSSDYISIPDDDTVFNFGSRMTAMVWVKGVDQLSKAVFSQYDFGANKRAWRIRSISSQKAEVDISSTGSSPESLASTANVFDNNWHLVGFTFNAGSLKLYVDAVAVSATVATTSIYNSDGNLAIGCNYSSAAPSEFFFGSIDEARLYNAAIPVSEIKEQYYAGLNNLLCSSRINASEYRERLDAVAKR